MHNFAPIIRDSTMEFHAPHNKQTRPHPPPMDETTYASDKKHLTDVQVGMCLTLNKVGWSQSEIADEFGVCQSTISRVLKRHNYETFNGRDGPPGRPRKTTERDDRHIIRIAKANHTLPFRDITNIITNNTDLNISPKTVARRCQEVQLISRYATRKPFLTEQHKKNRLEWALRHKDLTVEEWFKVIWSDECLMKVGQDSRRRRVLRQPGTELQEKNLSVSFKSSRVTIMIWACFSGERLGPILTLEQGGIGSEEYMDILYEGLVPMLDDLLNHHDDDAEEPDIIQVRSEYPYTFMHDNAPCHTTPEVLKLLEDEGIRVMKWPPNSPDLNPIEHLWPDLKHRFYLEFCKLRSTPSTRRTSYQQYEEIIHKLWDTTSRELIRSLMESMPRRCQAVIDNGGGHSGY